MALPGPVPPTLDDSRILELARSAVNGEKFRGLYDGDITGYGSRSEADAALAMMFGFWSQDVYQIQRLMESSRLLREKWMARIIFRAQSTEL